MEKLGIKAKKAISILTENVGNSYALLDTLAEPQGLHLQRWRVVVNVPEQDIMQWKEDS